MKEFERVLAYIYAPAANDMGTSQEESVTNSINVLKNEVGRIREALTAPINYLRFKEFLMEMCFMTE